jgi:hypothetical protein
MPLAALTPRLCLLGLLLLRLLLANLDPAAPSTPPELFPANPEHGV